MKKRSSTSTTRHPEIAKSKPLPEHPDKARIKPLLDELSRGNVPALADIASSLVLQFGGAEGLAKCIYDEYQHEDTPRNIKTRLLASVVDIVKATNTLTPPSDPESDALTQSPDILESELAALLQESIDD